MNHDFILGGILGFLVCLMFVGILVVMHSNKTGKQKEEDPADWWKHGRKEDDEEEEFQ